MWVFDLDIRSIFFCSSSWAVDLHRKIFLRPASNLNLLALDSEAAQESDATRRAKYFFAIFRRLYPPWGSQKLLKVITEVRSHSLIDFETTNHMYSIHPLVHVWTRTTMSHDEASRTRYIYPPRNRFRGLCLTLRAHIDTILKGSTMYPQSFSQTLDRHLLTVVDRRRRRSSYERALSQSAWGATS